MVVSEVRKCHMLARQMAIDPVAYLSHLLSWQDSVVLTPEHAFVVKRCVMVGMG